MKLSEFAEKYSQIFRVEQTYGKKDSFAFIVGIMTIRNTTSYIAYNPSGTFSRIYVKDRKGIAYNFNTADPEINETELLLGAAEAMFRVYKQYPESDLGETINTILNSDPFKELKLFIVLESL